MTLTIFISIAINLFLFIGMIESFNSITTCNFHQNVKQEQRSNHHHHITTRRNVFDYIGMDEIDAARLQYEALIGPLILTTSSSSLSSKTKPQHPKILTSTCKKRKEIEIQLLQSLEYSDDGIDELMSLWIIAECPNNRINSQTLIDFETIDYLSTYGKEVTLRKIITDSNMEWIEPMNRLAYILYMKREYNECQYWLNIILQEKPWHFDALQLQLLLVLSSSNHTSDSHHHYRSTSNRKRKCAIIPIEAIYWARKGLPPIHHTKRRKVWINNAINHAKHTLYQLEIQTDTIRNNDLIDHNSFSRNFNSNLNSITSSNNNDNNNNNGIWQ